MMFDALLFWGFVFHDFDQDPQWDGVREEKWEPTIAERLGLSDKDPDHKILTKALDERGVIVDLTGDLVDGSDMTFYVAASESVHMAAKVKDLGVLEVPQEWEKKLRSFCKEVGIPWVDPGWHLASYYG